MINKNDCTNNISNELDAMIEKIMLIEYHYDLSKLFSSIKDLSKKDKYNIYNNLINFYLKKIQKNKLNDTANVDQILDFFDYTYFYNDDKYYYLEDEAEIIVDNLVTKLIKDDKILKLPVELKNILTYGVSSNVANTDIEKLIMWIILKLAVLYNINK